MKDRLKGDLISVQVEEVIYRGVLEIEKRG